MERYSFGSTKPPTIIPYTDEELRLMRNEAIKEFIMVLFIRLIGTAFIGICIWLMVLPGYFLYNVAIGYGAGTLLLILWTE